MKPRSLLIAVGVVLLLALPFLVESKYYIRLVNLSLVFALLAISLNIVLGYAGQIALGHAGFFGIGAYTTALITAGGSGLMFWPAFLAAGAVTGVAGLLVGIPTLRLKGHYLALATLGFGEIVRHILFNWREVTHGMDGIGNIPAPALPGWSFAGDWRMYFLLLVVLALATVASVRLARSKYGRQFAAIRDAELAAGTTGVPVSRLKIIAFFTSAVLAGFAGALYAHLTAFISPDAFNFDVTAQVLTMVLIGGIGTTAGPIIGGVILTFLPELLRVSKAYYQLIYGAGIVAMIVFLPGGLLGWAKARWGAKPASTTAAADATAAPLEAVASAAEAFRVPRDDAAGGPILEVSGLTCAFGGVKAVDSVDLAVERGRIHALIGPNGAGKSTFINLVSGVYTATGGTMRLRGTPIGGLKPWSIAGLGLVRTFQNLRLFRTLTVEENVLVGCRSARPAGWHDVFLATSRAREEERELRAQAREALRFVGLEHRASEIVRTLPHEQQRLVEIARALVMRPALLLLDEPAAGMNPAEVERLIERVLRLRDLGITVLLVEHNMPLVMRLADRITVLNFGRKIAEGTPEQIRSDPQVIEAYLGHGPMQKAPPHHAAA